MVVWVHRIARADRFPRELTAAVRDDLVRVGVRARAGAGLKNIEREMFVELAFDHFFRRLHDERGPMRIEQTEIVVRLRRRPLDQAERADKRPRKSIAADRKVQNGSLRRRAVKRGSRDGHLAHRILLDARLMRRHAEWFTGNRCPLVDGITGRLWPFRMLVFENTVMNMGGIFCRQYSDWACGKTVACCRSSFVT